MAKMAVGDLVSWLAELLGDYEAKDFPKGYAALLERALAVQSRPRLERAAKILTRRMVRDYGWTFADARLFKRAFAKRGVKFTVTV